MNHLLDNDIYKFLMQQAVLEHFPSAMAHYKFINRGGHKFSEAFLHEFVKRVNEFSRVEVFGTDIMYLKSLGHFSESYLDWLCYYKFKPYEIIVDLDINGNFSLDIVGPWKQAILWEVPLLYTISGTYFATDDRDWGVSQQWNLSNRKIQKLESNDCNFIEFGTRRRRTSSVQDAFISQSVRTKKFLGTSNAFFANAYGIPCLGTNAHEWYQGISKLVTLRHANQEALLRWKATYPDSVKVALTDTFGVPAFLDDFNYELASHYSTVRQDSGDPYLFVNNMLSHWLKLGIDHTKQTIIFSDNLTVDKAISINNYVGGACNTAFGIGTHFTNDFPGSPPLNAVIKLWAVDGKPVAKLSADPAKASGTQEAIDEAMKIFDRSSNQ